MVQNIEYYNIGFKEIQKGRLYMKR